MPKIPNAAEIRDRIEKIDDTVGRLALMYEFLIAGRISEVAGDYEPLGVHAFAEDFEGEEAVLFAVQTAKRKRRGQETTRLRPCAVPLNPKYEPWSEILLEWFEERGERRAFPVSTRTLHRRARQAFDGFYYPIEQYSRVIDSYMDQGEMVHIREPVQAHFRPMATHALRHIRALDDLAVFYKFDAIDITIFTGWTSKTAAQQLPIVGERYLHLLPNELNLGLLKRLASRYFPKLLKSRGGFSTELSQEER